MSADSNSIGQWGEGVAAEYLESKGYTILTRNYHSPQGEIDIVAFNEDPWFPCLVFVEVKTRTSTKYGYPEEALVKKKWEHIQNAIQHYLETHPIIDLEWCVDVIAVLGRPNQDNPQIQHYENVVIVDE